MLGNFQYYNWIPFKSFDLASQCLKITQKVAFNIASEASNVYIFRQTLFPDRSLLIGQKLMENAKIQKFKYDILSNFQTLWAKSKLLKGIQL